MPEDPPEREPGRGAMGMHAEIAAVLKEHPGTWYPIGRYGNGHSATSVAYQIRSGRLSAYLPAGAYEATGRHVDEEYRVYARYVGEAATA